MNDASGTSSSSLRGHARLAASVILARPAGAGFEVFMLRRSERSAFAPDAFVFPGGTIDARDAGPAMHARALGLGEDRLAAEFRATVPPDLPSSEPAVDPANARALLVAALRELFEESGVLIARTQDGDPVDAARLHVPLVAEQRAQVAAGELAFADFLAAHGWVADAGALALFSHWITPVTEPRRYNTHFFVAIAPAGQAGLADADETHDGRWIAPAEALARHREHAFRLVYPTIKHLERLGACASVEELAAFARSKPILTIMPTESPDGTFAIPAHLEDAW